MIELTALNYGPHILIELIVLVLGTSHPSGDTARRACASGTQGRYIRAEVRVHFR